jgi:hypothetical protein
MAGNYGIKFYKNYKDLPHMVDQLLPIYARVHNPDNDIHRKGVQSTIGPPPEGSWGNRHTGFATIAFPEKDDFGDPISPMDKRKAFLKMFQDVYDNAVNFFVNGRPQDISIQKVLGDDWIEDMDIYNTNKLMENKYRLLERYYIQHQDELEDKVTQYIENADPNDPLIQHVGTKSPMSVFAFRPELFVSEDDTEMLDFLKKHPQSTEKHFLDPETKKQHVTMALARDGLPEYRAKKITPIEELEFVSPLSEEQLEEAINTTREFRKNKPTNIRENRLELLKALRKIGMSPYALSGLSEKLQHEDDEDSMFVSDDSILRTGNNDDAIRNIFNEIVKEENEYKSDLRLKNIMPSIRRRF